MWPIEKQEYVKKEHKVETPLKEKAMEHLLASCNRRECLKLIGMAYDRITYYDNIDQALSGLYGRGN